jgi:hypothetical protein
MPLTMDVAPLPAIETTGAEPATGPTGAAVSGVEESPSGCGDDPERDGFEAPARDEMWSRWA